MRKKIKKGCLVRLNTSVCFTKDNGGLLKYPLTNHSNDENGYVAAHRPTTPDEERAWRSSEVSKGLNDAGESKLPPRCTTILLRKDRLYEVLRARARIRLGWGNPTGGLTMILCTHTGEEAYVERTLLEVIS